MSYTVKIPVEYLVEEDGEWKHDIQPFTQVVKTDGSFDTREGGNKLIMGYTLNQRYELQFATEKDPQDEYLMYALFTGFYGSCKEVIRILELPEDTEIY